MDLETLLPTLGAGLFGIAVWSIAMATGLVGSHQRDREYVAWWKLVLPLFGGAVALAFVVGWAVQEPDPADERAGLAIVALAALTLAMVFRAVARSVLALRAAGSASIPVGTVGLFRPRTIISERFRSATSRPVLDAALAHEAAHARGRDPLRIWLAQLAADLQWPIPGARPRLDAWLLALEAQRDDEALARGTSPEDLAEAIVTAARLQGPRSRCVAARAAGASDGIAWRVRRLLADDATVGTEPSPTRQWTVRAACIVVILGAAWLGVMHGDAILGVLPGLDR